MFRFNPAGRKAYLLIIGLMPQVFGCGGSDAIRTYEVPRQAIDPSEIPFEVPPAKPGEPKVRFLGYLIPTSDRQQFWAVRFQNESPVVNQFEADFEAFVSSIRFDENGKPAWVVPNGWRVGQPPSPESARFRVVTLHKGPKKSPAAEIVFSYPSGGTVLSNVNRWRGGIGLPELTDEQLPKEISLRDIAGVASTRVDARGPGGKSLGMPPFAGKQ